MELENELRSPIVIDVSGISDALLNNLVLIDNSNEGNLIERSLTEGERKESIEYLSKTQKPTFQTQESNCKIRRKPKLKRYHF